MANKKDVITKKIIKVDDNGKSYLINGELEPNITYSLNENVYTTDNYRRIVLCKANPRRNPGNSRDIKAQLQVGDNDRRHSDQGGHIVGRDINGDSGIGNLIAMDSKINQSDYRRMENDIKANLDEGKNIKSVIKIEYPENSKRPDIITVKVITDVKKIIYKFDNNINGILMDDVPTESVDSVLEKLNSTNGSISSIKKVYNENNELTEVTINITYSDQYEVNHRTKVHFFLQKDKLFINN